MNKRTVKRAAGAGVSAAFAIGTLAALAPTPALAAASPDVIVAKAPGANTFVVGMLGSSFAFADPACDLVVVFVSNGFLTADDDRLETRVRLIEAARQDALVTA